MKMSEPRDRFCYECRKEGSPVDFFYRLIKEEDKVPLTEDEQDLLRSAGAEAIFAGLFWGFFPLLFLFLDFYTRVIDQTGEMQLSLGIRLWLGFVLAFMAYVTFLGFQMCALKRTVFRHRLNIRLYAFFYKAVHARNMRRNVIMLATLPRAMRAVDAIVFVLEKFAGGEGKAAPVVKKHAKTDTKMWVCSFCGYENTKASYSCTSCGKIKNTRLSRKRKE